MLTHARRTNQVVVTSNHDMIMLCAEENESVIWIDPRGRQFRRAEFVPLVFGRVEEWQKLLEMAGEPICVHVLRTKTEVLTLGRALSSRDPKSTPASGAQAISGEETAPWTDPRGSLIGLIEVGRRSASLPLVTLS